MIKLAGESNAVFNGRSYAVDREGFLVNPEDWDENFARGAAESTGIHGELTDAHWSVIRHLRKTFTDTGTCPLVFDLAREQNLRLADLQRLFPSGYLRGACKLAGLTYREEWVHDSWIPPSRVTKMESLETKVYRTNFRGFLFDSSEWDEVYALFKFREMNIGTPTEKHWDVIYFLRKRFEQTNKIPTVYETLEANGLELEDFASLFPAGYHRGAVKIAGLRQR